MKHVVNNFWDTSILFWVKHEKYVIFKNKVFF